MEHQKPDQTQTPAENLKKLSTSVLVERMESLSKEFSRMVQAPHKNGTHEAPTQEQQDQITANVAEQKTISDILESRGYTPGV